MQALAERLEAFIGGTTFDGADPLQFSALKTITPAVEDLAGLPVTSVRRRGKYVLLDIDGPRIAIHLSQGGRVDIEDPPKRTRPKGAVVRFAFTPARAVLIKEFGTERKAGWWLLEPEDEGPLTGLGPDADTPEYAELIRAGTDTRRLHTMLRDQKTVAGLGRGYTDDILHHARLSPFASLSKLSADDRERLIASTEAMLADGLKHERRRSGGLPSKLGDHWRVHNRYGHPCPDCEGDLRRVSYGSHEVTYCPACQTGGKILADRRMSRLIR